MTTKRCANKNCTVKKEQPIANFISKRGAEVTTCLICREHKALWKHGLTGVDPAYKAAVDRLFAGMVIRRQPGDRPEWLEIVNNG